jgi:hypothetical protein
MHPKSRLRCAYCHGEAGRSPVVCGGCKTVLHRDCFEILGACPTLGCGLPPPVEKDPWRPLGVVALVVLATLVGLGVRLVIARPRIIEPPAPVVPVEPRVPPKAPEPPPRNPEFVVWAGFGKGSFAEFEVVTSSTRCMTRTNIVAVRSDSITLETLETVLLEGNRSQTRVTSREVPASGTGPSAEDIPSQYFEWFLRHEADWSHGENEDIQVEGKPVRCRRLAVRQIALMETLVLLLSDEVPGGLCKVVTVSFDRWPSEVDTIRGEFEPSHVTFAATVTLTRFFKKDP